MSKVLVDREVLENVLANWHHISTADWDALKACTDQPAEAEGVDFGFDDRSVKVSQEAYSIFLEREQHHLAALSAVTAERDAALAENARLIEDRARFPDKPDDIGNMIGAHIGNLKAGKEQAESYARKWAAKADLLRKDAERWRYVSLQGDDTHWLNLLRVDLEDFGGNINAAVDALIDGEAPAMAAKGGV